MPKNYVLGQSDALVCMGMKKQAGGLAPYDPIFAAQQVAKNRGAQSAAGEAAESVFRDPNMWEKIPPWLRAGGIVGTATGVPMGALTYAQGKPDEKRRSHEMSRLNEALVAGLGTGMSFGIPMAQWRHGAQAPQKAVMDMFEDAIRNGKFSREGMFGPIKGVRQAVKATAKTAPDKSYTATGRGFAGIRPDPKTFRMDDPEFQKAVINATMGINPNPAVGSARGIASNQAANELLTELQQALMGAGLKDDGSEVSAFLSSLMKENPNLSQRDLLKMLHPDRLPHSPMGKDIDPELATEAFKQVREQGKGSSGWQEAVRDIGRRMRESRLERAERAQNLSRSTFGGLLDPIPDELRSVD